MDIEGKLRGYDDSALLKQMADGLVAREYASVEEAAKVVLGEESGSNVDRLRRKFREQAWYERGLHDYVETQIAERGLIKANTAARLCVRVEEAFRNPRPTLEGLVQILHVLIGRSYDVDGRKVTKKEWIGGFLRIVSVAMIPFILFDAFIYLIRLQNHMFGVEMVHLSLAMLALGFGMFWNRVSIAGDLRSLIEADRRWLETYSQQRRKCAEEYQEGRRELDARYRAGMIDVQ